MPQLAISAQGHRPDGIIASHQGQCAIFWGKTWQKHDVKWNYGFGHFYLISMATTYRKCLRYSLLFVRCFPSKDMAGKWEMFSLYVRKGKWWRKYPMIVPFWDQITCKNHCFENITHIIATLLLYLLLQNAANMSHFGRMFSWHVFRCKHAGNICNVPGMLLGQIWREYARQHQKCSPNVLAVFLMRTRQ